MAKKISAWKQKSAYLIVAPENFESRELGDTLARDPQHLMGRTIEVSMKDLVEDKTKQHLKVTFEVSGVSGNKANTRFKQFDVNPGYLRSKVRKGATKIDYIKKVGFESGKSAKIKVVVITHTAVQASRVKEMRAKITDLLDKYKESKVDDFVQSSLFGKLGTEIYREIKKVVPVRRVEIEQVRVL
jgi:small subunit ribosomal protein S3Ae